MSNDEVTVSFNGLTSLDVAELRASLAEAGADPAVVLKATKEPSDVTGPRKGEPATMLVIVALTQLTVTGLSIYLAKARSRSHSEDTFKFETPDGQKFEYTRKVGVEKQDEIHADLMKQIRTFNLPGFRGDDR
ncbi:hypothetical protein [Paraburkholderia diazotrophica]|uniref:Uncharacterized protein n=1 Tax=Paraburkholderia diazotrophica TaxID=667676 RepID=A0A1H7EIP4_9BURK|nr:hypothetical protein [Paraburkholderia diazotrophica]SEK13779.1 hypothetical protein SAMN05192539_10763 [Paraburkholderia diazotrophica]